MKRKHSIPEVWIVRYADGQMWTTTVKREEVEKEARKYHDAEIEAIL